MAASPKKFDCRFQGFGPIRAKKWGREEWHPPDSNSVTLIMQAACSSEMLKTDSYYTV